MGEALLLPLLSLLFFAFIRGAEPAATFTVTNSCGYTVWPGILSSAGASPPSTTGFALSPGETGTVSVTAAWSGRIWGRTLCDSSGGGFVCGTGDCGSGAVECAGRGAAPPATLAELTLAGGVGGDDFYDVSLVDGYNVPMLVTPQLAAAAANGSSSSCQPTGCPADLNRSCPAELSVVVGGDPAAAVVACKSACEAFGTARYCCSGAEHGTPATCAPTTYSRLFKAACPLAYSYAYDDATSTFTCDSATAAGAYRVVFCPGAGGTSTTSSTRRNPEAPADQPAMVYSSAATDPTTTTTGHAVVALVLLHLLVFIF